MPHEPFLAPPLDVRNSEQPKKHCPLLLELQYPHFICSKSNFRQIVTFEFMVLPMLQS